MSVKMLPIIRPGDHMKVNLKIPVTDKEIQQLRVGDLVNLTGVIVTGRDAVHKWLAETFIWNTRPQTAQDMEVYRAIKPILDGGMIYHCGPVVNGMDSRNYDIISAGPTTSIREEPYQADILRHFNIKGVIGKGGMGKNTLQACRDVPSVYLHAVGGAASLIARSIKRVIGVHKTEFGVPEAIWVLEVENFPVIVSMDSNGNSLHDLVRLRSEERLDRLISGTNKSV